MTDLSPRTILKITMYETRDCETVDHVAYECQQVHGVVDNGPGYEREILGFATFPAHTNVGRVEDVQVLRNILGSYATDFRWINEPEGGA